MLIVRFIMTLAIAGGGGWLFQIAELPLPWMLGALIAVTLSSLLQIPVYAPAKVRPPMSAVIGVMIGASFHPDLAGQILGWLPSFIGLVAFSFLAGLACSAYLFYVAKFDRTTAYFSGMPGGLVEMLEVGRERGGDEMTIALMHSARIFLIVMTVPFLVQWIEGTSIAAAPLVGEPILEASLTTLVLLVFCAASGLIIGRWIKLPAYALVGPMLVSAILHLGGFTSFVPPTEIVQVAQVVMGAVIGSRFSRATPRQVLKILGIACGMAVVLLVVVSLSAALISAIVDQDFSTLILAYSPGGLNEMGLIAVAIQADIAFVASHHLFRILIVMLGAPHIFSLLDRLEWVKEPPTQNLTTGGDHGKSQP
jgi:membrane AbrB-like protein